MRVLSAAWGLGPCPPHRVCGFIRRRLRLSQLALRVCEQGLVLGIAANHALNLLPLQLQALRQPAAAVPLKLRLCSGAAGLAAGEGGLLTQSSQLRQRGGVGAGGG